jgi:hypothetical protein
MTPQDFEKVFFDRVSKSEATLIAKAREYATGTDRFHNFKKTAAFRSCTPENALWGMVSKHLVALSDFIDQLEAGEDVPDAQWDEKIGDSINYLMLLDGLIEERKFAQATKFQHSMNGFNLGEK